MRDMVCNKIDFNDNRIEADSLSNFVVFHIFLIS